MSSIFAKIDGNSLQKKLPRLKLAGKANNLIAMTDESFLDALKSLKSKEENTDCFCIAGLKRKTLLLNYYGILKVKNCPQTMEFLVNEELDSYAGVIDNKDPGKVNNYTDCIFSVLSNVQNDERHSWKSQLGSLNLKGYLEPLPCVNRSKCSNATKHFSRSQTLKQAFLQYKESNESEVIKAYPGGNDKIFKKDLPLKNNIFPAKNVQDNEHIAKNIETYFHTAKDELLIQNARKFGKNSNPIDKPVQGQMKKTLGARKNGVFGKFQPPIRANEYKDDNKVDIDQPVEERLKNIDPAMVELIKNEIMDCGSKITWDHIAGLQLAKSTIQEIVVWPMLRPDIFTGLRRPPKGILLFGPPGTGKTLIGKCIASQSNSTFFSISASSLTSKWVGDGEKMVRTLFAVAKVYQPSVIFIDEIDSLLTQRTDSDHECSRRIKTEFLVQLDGAGTGDEDRILIIGATNRPQELDEAARRRLVKRLYIPLPDEKARTQIIQNLISTERHCLTESEIQNVAKMTKGYSGADVKNLCQEASLGPIRSIAPTMIQSINPEDVRPVNIKDFESALCRIKSSVSEKDLDIYLNWDKQYGCGSACG